MLRPVFILRVVALVSLFYALYVIRCQYLFQQYLRTRLITSGDFPPLYVEALNDSVAHGKQPLDFDYASTFTKPEIPRIIHFIWFQNLYPTHDGASQIPTSSSRAPELCREFNPEFEVRIWDATMARTFLEKEYSWFLPTYDGYRYPIQRVDALKYFALYHYGGVYMDLDISCRRPLDPLLSFPAWFPEASPLGVNNDLMAARAGHPILELMTAELKRRDKNWLFPYLTIFWSTGPQFSSDVLKKWVEYERFHRAESTDPRPDAFFVLPQIYYSEQYTFFGHSPGGTWHGGDVAVVLWIVDRPWVLLAIPIVLTAIIVKLRRSRRRRIPWTKKDVNSDMA